MGALLELPFANGRGTRQRACRGSHGFRGPIVKAIANGRIRPLVSPAIAQARQRMRETRTLRTQKHALGRRSARSRATGTCYCHRRRCGRRHERLGRRRKNMEAGNAAARLPAEAKALRSQFPRGRDRVRTKNAFQARSRYRWQCRARRVRPDSRPFQALVAQGGTCDAVRGGAGRSALRCDEGRVVQCAHLLRGRGAR